ncbi:MAG: GNAT family N-acetyltransferase [Muribaculum sp.]|nr:GNAT family N-acetyltransferase [Muribaculaceae bacterium]MCM1081184.1 GNAT family N-acetyltransferase [Muribaculum sp.]
MNQFSTPIIDAVNVDLLESELTHDRFLRDTCKGGNQIYIVDGRHAPNVMHEIGRLREISFRAAGGGTGKDCDIDEFDLMDPPCRQLVVWDPKSREILGGYRFIAGHDIRLNADGSPRLATSHIFRFSDEFINNYLPYTIELGRSFVRIEQQATRDGVRALYTLDNLWDGLGALTVVYPQMRYLFGKVTMYPNYNSECRNMILYFLLKHFPDKDNLVEPIIPLKAGIDNQSMEKLFSGSTFKDDYKVLNKAIRDHGINIPPLVNAYMSLSPSMRMFGTAINTEFGNVEESGIFFVIDEIFEEKKGRHIGSFFPSDSKACNP